MNVLIEAWDIHYISQFAELYSVEFVCCFESSTSGSNGVFLLVYWQGCSGRNAVTSASEEDTDENN